MHLATKALFLAFLARKLTMDMIQIDNSACLLTDDFSQQQFLKNANSTNIIFYNILSIRVHPVSVDLRVNRINAL